CFDGPDDLIPGIALSALICQLEYGTGRSLVAKSGYRRRSIGRMDYSDSPVGGTGPEENVVIDGPKDREGLPIPGSVDGTRPDNGPVAAGVENGHQQFFARAFGSRVGR